MKKVFRILSFYFEFNCTQFSPSMGLGVTFERSKWLKNVQKEFEQKMYPGGSNPGVPQTNNVDILDTTTGTWHTAESLPVARSAPGCILTEMGGQEGVLLTGGFNTAMGEHLYDTLFFDLATGKWSEVTNKNHFCHSNIILNIFVT